MSKTRIARDLAVLIGFIVLVGLLGRFIFKLAFRGFSRPLRSVMS